MIFHEHDLNETQDIEIVGCRHPLINQQDSSGLDAGTINYIKINQPDLLTIDGTYTYEAHGSFVLTLAKELGIDQRSFLFADPGMMPSIDPTARLVQNSAELLAERTISLAIIGALTYALSSDDVLKIKISRRSFIRSSIMTAGILKESLRVIPSFLLDDTSDRNTRRLLQTLYSYGGPILTRFKWWLDGRTALMIQKNIEADYKSKQVILGTAHLSYADKILHDQQFRDELIYNYMYNVLSGLNSMTPEKQAEAQIKVAEECSRSEIYKYNRDSHTLNYVDAWHSPRIAFLATQLNSDN